MFNKKDIIREMLRHPELKEAAVLHGGSLVLQGIKETTEDIDLHLPCNLWGGLDKTKLEQKDGSWIYKNQFDLGLVDVPLRHMLVTEVDYLPAGNGKNVLFQRTASIVEEKVKWGRPKDLEAIKLVVEFYRREGRLNELGRIDLNLQQL